MTFRFASLLALVAPLSVAASLASCDVFDEELEAQIGGAGTGAGGTGAGGESGSGGAEAAGGDEGAGGASGTGGGDAGAGAGGADGGNVDAGDDAAAGGAGAGGAGAGGAGTGGVPSITGADFCEPLTSVTVRETDDQFLSVPTTGFSNDFSDLSSCGVGRTLGETDGFFRVQLTAGSRYHFHVRAAPEQNIAVYLLSSCDERTCVGAVDSCPAGTDEHFSFVPATGGTYVLGIDGISNGPTTEPVTFLATRSNCGDSVKQHSEVCDDGDLDDTNGCDTSCRAVLGAGASELEPNADRYGANVVTITGGTPVSIQGNLGGPCDTDTYLLRIPQGGSLRATVLSAAGTACAGNPDTELRFLNGSLVQLVRTEAVGTCPVLDDAAAQGLAAGDYYVSVRTKGPESPFPYQIRFELTTPP